MKKILILDNYDSFTYNLVQIVEELTHQKVDVYRNNEIDLSAIEKYESIILSPGPGLPQEAGILKDVIKTYSQSKKIFGVCLGLQAIGEVYNCKLKNLDKVFHGMATTMYQTEKNSIIFKDVPKEFIAGRYHSWVIDNTTIDDNLEITSFDTTKEIMSVEHKLHAVYGVQFHPESILTPEGRTMISNFLSL